MRGNSDRLGNLLVAASLLILALLAAWTSAAQDAGDRGCVTRDNQGRNVTVNVRSGPGLEFSVAGFVVTGECYDVLEIVDRQSGCNAYCEWVELASIPVGQRSSLSPTRLYVWGGLFDVETAPTPTITPTATFTHVPTVTMPPVVATALTETAMPTLEATPTPEIVPGEVFEFCRIEIQARDNGWIAIFERCEVE